MARTQNVKAMDFAVQELYLEPPDPNRPNPLTGWPMVSLAVSDLATRFCEFEDCEWMEEGAACRKHRRAMLLGASKLISGKQLLGELSRGGKMYARLSPQCVTELMSRPSPPGWLEERPDVLNWINSR